MQPPVALNHHVVGRRIVAAIIDGIVLAVGFALMAGVFGDVDTGGRSDFRFHLSSGPFFFYVVASFAYFVFMESQFGATLGKMALAIKVVRMDGSPCGFGEAMIRNVLRIVDGFPAFYLLGMLVVSLTPRNQRIGDLAASTLVVATEGSTPSPAHPTSPGRQDTIDELREVARLHEEGLLTDEEYESKRKGLVDRL